MKKLYVCSDKLKWFLFDRVLTKRFSISWFLSSWILALCFVVILVNQIEPNGDRMKAGEKAGKTPMHVNELKYVRASEIFPGDL